MCYVLICLHYKQTTKRLRDVAVGPVKVALMEGDMLFEKIKNFLFMLM